MREIRKCYIKVGGHAYVTGSDLEYFNDDIIVHDAEVSFYRNTIISVPMDLEFFTRIEAEAIKDFLVGRGFAEVDIIKVGDDGE
ncbi:hypothetical protein P9293_18410 [Bacillus inaquosorum]|uniref:hypothetical protein n=1 Tax=Bacillus inaquosorum TaxID=483913 RepID=UPI002E24C2EC|nr:hypothetical protein [Bacillus inaquosorum]MED4790327.1 hypothetical protein [Bacillus inaquosorum]